MAATATNFAWVQIASQATVTATARFAVLPATTESGKCLDAQGNLHPNNTNIVPFY
jgi:hypothetical protein